VLKEYAALKSANPAVPILVREAAGIEVRVEPEHDKKHAMYSNVSGSVLAGN